MNKPEKKVIPSIEEVCPQLKGVKTATEVIIYHEQYDRHILPLVVHNQAIDDYEKFLPSEKEIVEILHRLGEKQFRSIVKAVDKKGLMNTDWNDIDKEGGKLDFSIIAKTIAKRIGK